MMLSLLRKPSPLAMATLTFISRALAGYGLLLLLTGSYNFIQYKMLSTRHGFCLPQSTGDFTRHRRSASTDNKVTITRRRRIRSV